MKKIILLCFFLSPFTIAAQQAEFPYDYDFSVNNDYEKYNSTVVDIADWMTRTPINERPQKRQQYQTFLMNWVAGHPKVKVLLNEWTNATEIGDKNPVLLIIFIAAWSKESVISEEYDNLTRLHFEAIKSVSQFYKDNREFLRKDRCVEKYIKLEKKGKLYEWIKKRVE